MTREVGERVNSMEKGKMKVGEDDEEVVEIVKSTEKGKMKVGEYDWEVDDIINSTEKGEMKVGEYDGKVDEKSNSHNEDLIYVELNKDLHKMQNPSIEDAHNPNDLSFVSPTNPSTEDAHNPNDLSFVPPTINATPMQSRKRKHTTPVTTPQPPMLDLPEKFADVEDSDVVVQCRQLLKYCKDLIDQELKKCSGEHEKILNEVIASTNHYRTCGMEKSESVIERVKVKEFKAEVEDFHVSQASVVRCNARLGIVEEALILQEKTCKQFLDVAKIVREKMDALNASQVSEVPALVKTQPLVVSADPPVVEVPIESGNYLLNQPNTVLPPNRTGA